MMRERKHYRNPMLLTPLFLFMLLMVNIGWSITPNDTYYPEQAFVFDLIEAPAAWEFVRTHQGIPIAIIDNGYQNGGIPDLEARLLDGWDFVGDDPYPHARPGENHGTKMASVIAALTDNAQGVAGVSWGGMLVVYRVYDRDDDELDPSRFKQAVHHAIDNFGVRIISASVSRAGHHPDLQEAVNYATANNCLIIAAAGNGSFCLPGFPQYVPVEYPAAYSGALAVGSITWSGYRAIWSNVSDALDIVAPENIYAVTGGYQYAYAVRTSASTALTAGIAALALANNPSLSYAQLKQLLFDSCDDIQYGYHPCGPPGLEYADLGWDNKTGYGRINLFKALSGLRYSVTHRNSPTGIAANPGDYIDFWTLGADYVGRRTLTPDDIPPDGYFRWNGLIDNGLFWFAPGIYIYKKNGGSPHTTVLEQDIGRPAVSNARLTSCSTVAFDLSEGYGPTYIYVAIFGPDGNFIRFDLEKVLVVPWSVELTLQQPFEQGQTVKIFAIDVAGNLGYAIAEDPPLAPPEDLAAINNWSYYQQYQNVKVFWDDLCWGDGVAIERKPDGGSWSEIGRVSGQSYFIDKTALGSELYHYRARTYEGGNYSSYSETVSRLTWPQIPENVFVFVNPIGSNRVYIDWDAPTQQKPNTISNYTIRRLEGGGNAVYYGPYTSGPVKLCEDIETSHTYIFGVRSNDIYNNSSIYTADTVTTGQFDWCVGTPDGGGNLRGVTDIAQIPKMSFIGDNYPNPFNSSTTFPLGLAQAASVDLRIYNIAGREVAVLVDNQTLNPGYYYFRWGARDINYQALSSGIYFYACKVGTLQQIKKVLLVK